MTTIHKTPGIPYPLECLWSEEDQAFIAYAYDLPGCVADGKTAAAAVDAIAEVIRLWLEVATEEGRPIPIPSSQREASGKFNVRIPRTLHVRLRREADREGVSLNELVTALLAQREAEVRTAVTLRSRTENASGPASGTSRPRSTRGARTPR